MSKINEQVYFVRGMHCASCEVLIEKEIINLRGVESVDAKAGSGQVVVEYTETKPSVYQLNKLFEKEGYIFLEKPFLKDVSRKNNIFPSLLIAGGLIAGFLLLSKSGLSGLVNVNSSSSVFAFFLFGLLAGLSSCAALVGGIILSMSKQWLQVYSEKDSTFQKLSPHIMFNAGRLVSYTILGAVLGVIGSQLKISLTFTSFIVIAVSVLMMVLAGQMLGIKKLAKFQFAAPKFISRYVADEANFRGRYMPFIMGALTFFLPCGFTITAQGMALLSGNAFQGATIMFAFVLGTVLPLLFIGLSSIKLSTSPKLAMQFSKIAGFLILFFALFNINNQLSVLGYSNLGSIRLLDTKSGVASATNLPEIVDGKQIIKMDAFSYGYKPNYIKVKVNVPVRWEITDRGTSGCTNAVISKGLFSDSISLTPGTTSVKEFTPTRPGKYKFSCWMGMVSGTIEVVDVSSATSISAAAPAIPQEIIPSGAKGCGCGGGGGSSCGAR